MAESVTAEVILRGSDGASVCDAPQPPTATDITHLRIDDIAAAEVTQKLGKKGIQVVQRGPVSLSIRADKPVFERVFATHLHAAPMRAAGTGLITYEADVPVHIPEDLQEAVADVVLPVEVEFHP